MRFLTAIFDAFVGFVQRNPLLTLLIFLLALGAPALLKGIAIFILYFILAVVVLGLGLALYFRWRLARVRCEMEERFGAGGFDARFGGRASGGQPHDGRREGDVRVHRTTEAPEKRVSDHVGDYVEFEETGKNDA